MNINSNATQKHPRFLGTGYLDDVVENVSEWHLTPIFLVGCDDNVTNVETQYKNIVWNGWYKFDYYIMKPILTHNGPPLTATCPSFCHPITNCFTSHEAYTNHNDDDNEVIFMTH